MVSGLAAESANPETTTVATPDPNPVGASFAWGCGNSAAPPGTMAA